MQFETHTNERFYWNLLNTEQTRAFLLIREYFNQARIQIVANYFCLKTLNQTFMANLIIQVEGFAEFYLQICCSIAYISTSQWMIMKDLSNHSQSHWWGTVVIAGVIHVHISAAFSWWKTSLWRLIRSRETFSCSVWGGLRGNKSLKSEPKKYTKEDDQGQEKEDKGSNS